MHDYLQSSSYIDWISPQVVAKATQLAGKEKSEIDIVRSCFEFVRDEIKHSLDYRLNPVTCKASEVLKEGTGFCFSKSHLLAALLRANQIPAALVYQRIAFGEEKNAYYWHGLNAVYLAQFGWYRLDPRGRKEGLVSECSPPHECLPFTPRVDGEIILEQLWAEPSMAIIQLLESSTTYTSLIEKLPSIHL